MVLLDNVNESSNAIVVIVLHLLVKFWYYDPIFLALMNWRKIINSTALKQSGKWGKRVKGYLFNCINIFLYKSCDYFFFPFFFSSRLLGLIPLKHWEASHLIAWIITLLHSRLCHKIKISIKSLKNSCQLYNVVQEPTTELLCKSFSC